jgi:GTPase KRas protein
MYCSRSVVLVANKLDRSAERQVTHAEGEALAKELGNIPFFESSAKLNIHIEDAFFDCARACRAIRYPDSAPASRVQSRRNTAAGDGGTVPAKGGSAAAPGTTSSGGDESAGSRAPQAQTRRKSDGDKKKKKGCIIV